MKIHRLLLAVAIFVTLFSVVTVASAQNIAPEATPDLTVPQDTVVISPDGTVTIATSTNGSGSPAEAASASITLIAGILVGFLGGGLTVGALASFIMRDPSRIALLEKLGDSVPPATAATITTLAERVLEISLLVRETFDGIPHRDKLQTGTGETGTTGNPRDNPYKDL